MKNYYFIYENLNEFYFIQKYLIDKGYKHDYYKHGIKTNILKHEDFIDNGILGSGLFVDVTNKIFSLYYKQSNIFKECKSISAKFFMRQQKLNNLYK